MAEVTQGHIVWSDTNCAFGLIGAMALDAVAKMGLDPISKVCATAGSPARSFETSEEGLSDGRG